MATKRTRRKPDPAGFQQIVVDDTTDDQPEDILAVLQQLGGEASICQLWRRDDKRKYAYLDECDPDAFDLKMIRDVWGGGEYQVRFLDSNRGYLKARSFAVYGAAKQPAAAGSVTTPGQPASAVGDPSVMMLEMMKMFREELRTASARVDPTAANPLEMAMKMAEMIQSSTLGAIQSMGLGNKGNGGLTLPDLLSAIPQFMELAREYAGGEKGSALDNALLTLGTKVLEKMEGQPGTSVTNVPTQLPGPTDPGARARPAWASIIQRSMPQLLNWAAAGKDARLYAEVLLDNLPDAAGEFLGQQLARGSEFLDEFYVHFPDAATHKWWFDSLYREIGILLNDDGGDDDETTTETEDA